MSLSLFKDGCGDIAVFVFLSGWREFGIYDASKVRLSSSFSSSSTSFHPPAVDAPLSLMVPPC
jgi:hypothetical protein